MSVKVITAETRIDNIDRHVKVYAGPGAGKTRWLINHIKQVLHTSTRLYTSRKIACITYTNIGAETILKRLGHSADRVEISTIHSFLYKHLIKPYIYLLASEYSINYLEIDGHDDVVMSGYQFIEDWKTSTGQKYISSDDNDKLVAIWREMRWKFNATGALNIETKYPPKVGGYNLKNGSLLVYKKMMWSKGMLHHEDVLFFSYELLTRHKFLVKVLRAKFPYYFVDEFQDTHPIQTKIIELIAQEETTVAVIGDPAQSIYVFLGADYKQMDSFNLAGMDTYRIEGNFRSTHKIVALLNHVRRDLTQVAQRTEEGTQVVVVIGDKFKAVDNVKNAVNGQEVYALSWDNLTINKIRKGIDTTAAKRDLLDQLEAADKSSDRRRAVIKAAKAIEWARQGFFKDAIKELQRFPSITTEPGGDKKKQSLLLLKKMLDGAAAFENGTLLKLIEFIQANHLATIKNLRPGAALTFYSSIKFKDITVAIKSLDESGVHRTIHKAKGEEFDNVLLIIDLDEKGKYNEQKELGFILTPDLNNEDHRVKYVAISRARQKLFLSVPNMSSETLTKLQALDMQQLNV